MDNTISLVCKNCGGHLSYKNNCSLLCDSCATELIINEPSENFTIVAGKLEKYTGSSTIVIIPDNVMTIGENAFKNLFNITYIVLPSSVNRIENSAFEGCTNLCSIDIPTSVDYIGDFAFKNSGLTKLIINGNLKYIGHEAFMCCANLNEITMHGSFDESGLKVFKQCSKLKSVNMNLKLFSGSTRPSMEVKKSGDKRPTFFDFFQGTIFFNELSKKDYRKCFYCNGDLDRKGICTCCGEKDYDLTQQGTFIGFKGKRFFLFRH